MYKVNEAASLCNDLYEHVTTGAHVCFAVAFEMCYLLSVVAILCKLTITLLLQQCSLTTVYRRHDVHREQASARRQSSANTSKHSDHVRTLCFSCEWSRTP
jgi:hypothetical protein